MTIAAAPGQSAKRFMALALAYVLALQAMFSGVAQLRVLLSETPGICTILGFKDAGKPGHHADVCAQHCVAQAFAEPAVILAATLIFIGAAAWARPNSLRPLLTPKPELGFRGRAPPAP